MVELRDGDYMKNILAYIEKNTARGYSIDQIRFTLMQHGYSRAAIERGLRMFERTRPAVPAKPIIQESPVVEAVAEPVAEEKGFFSKMFGFFKK